MPTLKQMQERVKYIEQHPYTFKKPYLARVKNQLKKMEEENVIKNKNNTRI